MFKNLILFLQYTKLNNIFNIIFKEIIRPIERSNRMCGLLHEYKYNGIETRWKKLKHFFIYLLFHDIL